MKTSRIALDIRRVGYGQADAMRLIAAVQDEYVVRYGGPDETPLEPEMFEPPTGSFFVAYAAGLGGPRPVATGAWRRRDQLEVFDTNATAEIKRMYVVPHVRKVGVARAMLAHLEQSARDAGFEALVLETGTKQPEAIALYESSGYTPIPSFGHYRDEPLNRCFGKSLIAPPEPPLVEGAALQPS